MVSKRGTTAPKPERDSPTRYCVIIYQVDPKGEGPDEEVKTEDYEGLNMALAYAKAYNTNTKATNPGSGRYAVAYERKHITPWFPTPGIQDGWDFELWELD